MLEEHERSYCDLEIEVRQVEIKFELQMLAT
jgi:hypothetical protein